MNKPVLFAGTRPYGRAENISALYDAYQGEKKYLGIYDYNEFLKINDKDYDILVIDEFPRRFSKVNIMIWHAIQGGKYIGFNQPSPYINSDLVKRIDYIIQQFGDYHYLQHCWYLNDLGWLTNKYQIMNLLQIKTS